MVAAWTSLPAQAQTIDPALLKAPEVSVSHVAMSRTGDLFVVARVFRKPNWQIKGYTLSFYALDGDSVALLSRVSVPGIVSGLCWFGAEDDQVLCLVALPAAENAVAPAILRLSATGNQFDATNAPSDPLWFPVVDDRTEQLFAMGMLTRQIWTVSLDCLGTPQQLTFGQEIPPVGFSLGGESTLWCVTRYRGRNSDGPCESDLVRLDFELRLSRSWKVYRDVHTVRVSPDGRYLACISSDCPSKAGDEVTQLRVYDLRTMHEQFRIEPFSTYQLAWSSDSSQLLALTGADAATLLDLHRIDAPRTEPVQLPPGSRTAVPMWSEAQQCFVVCARESVLMVRPSSVREIPFE